MQRVAKQIERFATRDTAGELYAQEDEYLLHPTQIDDDLAQKLRDEARDLDEKSTTRKRGSKRSAIERSFAGNKIDSDIVSGAKYAGRPISRRDWETQRNAAPRRRRRVDGGGGGGGGGDDDDDDGEFVDTFDDDSDDDDDESDSNQSFDAKRGAFDASSVNERQKKRRKKRGAHGGGGGGDDDDDEASTTMSSLSSLSDSDGDENEATMISSALAADAERLAKAARATAKEAPTLIADGGDAAATRGGNGGGGGGGSSSSGAQSAKMRESVVARTQNAVWNRAVNVRIALQPLLSVANRLPLSAAAVDGNGDNGDDTAAAKLRARCASSIAALFAQIEDTQRALHRAATRDNNDDDDNDDVPSKAPLDTTEAWARVEQMRGTLSPWLTQVLGAWAARTQQLSASGARRGATAGGALKALNQHVVAQVDAAFLHGRDRLRKRTRIVRGKELQRVGDAEVVPVDAECDDIFDDNDFFAFFLRDVMEESNSSQSRLAAQTAALLGVTVRGADGGRGARSAANEKATSTADMAKKRSFITKKRKGKALKYDVHPKLVNFCAPRGANLGLNWDVDELFDNLFKS